MLVYCPGCGTKIDARPNPDSTRVQCPRCQSTFNVEGVKAVLSALPTTRPRKKKAGGGMATGILILVAILLVLGGGTAAILYWTGVFAARSSPGTAEKPSSVSPNTTASAGWKQFGNSEAKFSARFPGVPKRTQRSLRGRARDVAFELEVNGVAYGVVYADLDKAGMTSTTPEQSIEQERQTLAGRGTVQSEKAIALGPYKGKEFVIEMTGQKMAHLRFYAAGRRLYSVLVVGKTRSPEPGDVAALFDSFRILD